MAVRKSFERYGLCWPANMAPIDVLGHCVRKGGQWKDQATGRLLGAPLFDLYREATTILWGDRCEHHEWSDLVLKTILTERITTIIGPHDTGKTHLMSRYALLDYWWHPRDTLVLMSSTDIRGLELRVWGEVKDLFNLGKEVWPEAPGMAVDSLHGIFSDEIDPDNGLARDIRRGLICIPVLDSEGQWKGLSKFAGIKQKRRRILSDEVQFYPQPYITTLSNLNKGDFKGVFSGNPIGEEDPLDKLSEPQDGWDGQPEVTKTTTWRNRMGGVTLNLYGPDSPAIRHPGKFEYLINQADLDRIIDYWGKESAEWWNQGAGVRRPGISARRIVTRDMVQQYNAQGEVVWLGTPRTSIYAIDSGYGGDRCVAGHGEFGQDINKKWILWLSRPRVIPIKIFGKNVAEADRKSPEDQIADYVKTDCERLAIPSANVFHDATGRGSLGTAFARLWRPDTNPVEFGGNPTPRPVLSDMFVFDEKLRQRRLVRCDEYYSKRVSEFHFSVRYTIEGGQMRGLTNEVVAELCAREWGRTKGNRIEVEAKEDTKERWGRSPDFADWAAIVVEGARRLGFQIARFESAQKSKEPDDGWKDDLRKRAKQFHKSFALTYDT